MATVKIEVTLEDIESGKRQVCALCPVALAIKRHTLSEVEVFSLYVRFAGSMSSKMSVSLPMEVSRWIYCYDRDLPSDKPMNQPFAFDLEIPDNLLGAMKL